MSLLTSRHAARYNGRRRGSRMTDPSKATDASNIRLDPMLAARLRSDGALSNPAVIEAVARLVSRGYKVLPPSATADGQPSTRTVAELAGLESAPPLTLPEVKKMNVGQMIQLWQAWDREKFRGTPNFYKQA